MKKGKVSIRAAIGNNSKGYVRFRQVSQTVKLDSSFNRASRFGQEEVYPILAYLRKEFVGYNFSISYV